MTQPTATATETKSHFDAAKEIVAALRELSKEHQSLAFKFAMETLGLAVPPTHAVSVSSTPPPHREQQLGAAGLSQASDIKSFTATKSPKTDQQFAAVVAYFYQFMAPADARKEAVDAVTMKEAARQAGRAQVSNWTMTLNNAKNAGYLDPAGAGKFKLNAVGENLVAITLPGDSGSGAGNGIGLGQRAAKKKAAIKKSARKAG